MNQQMAEIAEQQPFLIRTSIAGEIKRALSGQIKAIMNRDNISQAELARRMGTSRAVVRRLLDDEDISVTLATISKTALALDLSVQIELKG